MKKFLILLFILFSQIGIAQTQKLFNKAEYDSLKILVVELRNEKTATQNSIDSIKQKSYEMDGEMKDCRANAILKKYGDDPGQKIANGMVWKGMTEEMFYDSYGKPDKREKNKENWGVFTQWYFGNDVFFFRDGILQGWKKE